MNLLEENSIWILIVIPIITSFVSAVMFWLTFDLFPRKRRKSKIRPMIEYELYRIYSSLLAYFDICFHVSGCPGKEVKYQLHSGKLTVEEIRLALGRKCLDAKDLYDENKDKLVPIGDRLEYNTRKIEQSIDNLYKFSSDLPSNLILVLRKLLVLIRTYGYEGMGGSIVNGRMMFAVNPTISYMANNIHEIYGQFLLIQEYVFKIKKLDQYFGKDTDHMILSAKIDKALGEKDYKYCIKLCGKDKRNLHYKVEALRAWGKLDESIDAIREYLSCHSNLELISLRSPFRDCYNDPDVKRVLITTRLQKQYDKMVECIENEAALIAEDEKISNDLMQYYKDKCESITRINRSKAQ